MSAVDELLAFDQQHLWHPYSSIGCNEPTYPVQSAHGVRIELADGRQLIDGMASWWCAIHGYNHPALNRAIETQLEQMSHVMFGGLTHEPAVNLGKRLLEITPAALQAIFYADSGSVAVEVALKMAVQYQQTNGKPGCSRMLTVRGGYHGDTSGAMAVSDPENGMHGLFSGMLAKHIYAPRPVCRFDDDWDENDLNAMEDLIERHQREVAAIIVEPIVQGAGGFWFYHPQYLRELRSLCDQYGVLLIFDEIATGFGRTGEMFAMRHAGVVPDILCIGKAMTGGMMTLAAVMTTRRVAETVNASAAGVLMHGPTFMANPLACAAASASIDLLLQSNWQDKVRKIESTLRTELEPARTRPAVVDVRVLGAIGVIEMIQPVDRAALCAAFVAQGVWIRPYDRYIYIMPPYVIEDDDLRKLCQAMLSCLV